MTFFFCFFFFNDTATTEIYTLSLHDALPIFWCRGRARRWGARRRRRWRRDRKSTRLNSSHTVISYAVFCLKKKTRAREGRGARGDGSRPHQLHGDWGHGRDEGWHADQAPTRQ